MIACLVKRVWFKYVYCWIGVYFLMQALVHQLMFHLRRPKVWTNSTHQIHHSANFTQTNGQPIEYQLGT